MTASDKDTIYIDIDDEITGIIDKLNLSSGKVVALVLPKRAAVFQSIVNMKLLKRAADDSKKNLVLITSEAGLLPLAGAAGVHVAKTLTSKPAIPLAPAAFNDLEETVQEDGTEPEVTDDTDTVDPQQTVGQLAGLGAAGAVGKTTADDVETLVLDDEASPPEADDGPVPTTFEPPTKKNKKLAIPNFERFRLWLALGVLLLIALIGGLIFAAEALPKATITIKTDATNLDTNVPFSLSTTATTLDATTNTVPAKLASIPKTFTQQVSTTGQKNNGNKASGSVTLVNCSPDNTDIEIPAGTGVSASGQTYITQAAVSLPLSGYHKNNGSCQSFDGVTSANVQVIAQSGGTSSNATAGSTMTVAGYGNVTAHASSAITGGTDSIVQTVNQNDINGAKAKIVPNEAEVKQSLISQLQQAGYDPLAATYTAGAPAVTTSANVGDIANSVTVTEVITYTEFGVHKADLHTLVGNNIKGQIDTSKQGILNDGVDTAAFNVDSLSATDGKLTMTGKAEVGPELNTDTIKQHAAGQKPGPVRDQLQANPDVTSVDVKLSPFWVSAVPKKTSRITVTIAKPVTTAKASTSNDTQP